MPTLNDTSTTSLYGWAKLIVGGLGMLSGVIYGVATHDWKGALGIVGSGGTLAGFGSAGGLIAAKDDKNK